MPLCHALEVALCRKQTFRQNFWWAERTQHLEMTKRSPNTRILQGTPDSWPKLEIFGVKPLWSSVLKPKFWLLHFLSLLRARSQNSKCLIECRNSVSKFTWIPKTSDSFAVSLILSEESSTLLEVRWSWFITPTANGLRPELPDIIFLRTAVLCDSTILRRAKSMLWTFTKLWDSGQS